MRMARVIGHVVSTIKESSHQGYKLLVVQPVSSRGEPSEPSHLCIDLCQAGIGDHVLILQEGIALRFLTDQPRGAVDAATVGVIDYVETRGVQYRLGDVPPERATKKG
jgi:ethanolamine utilization protein EutN